MKKTAFSILALLLFARCVTAQTQVSGNQSGTWTKAASPYILTGTVTVPTGQTLTLQPGVVVQFAYFNYDLTVNGTLTAVGTAADSIRFKGKWYDNNSTHGGEINFASTTTNSVLDYVVIDSLGDTYFSANSSAVYINSPAKPTINHTRIAHTKASEDINTWLGGAEFITNTPNTILGIRGGTSSGNTTLNKQGGNSYYRLLGSQTIASGDTLTLQPGVVVQFPYFNYDLTVNGTLTAVGTAADSIRFKGKWYDNNSTHGGEINFNSTTTNSVLDYVVIDSLGDTYFSANSSAVYINSPAKPTINHTRIAHTKASEDINTWLGGAEFITNTPNTILGIRGGTSSGNSTLPKPGANSYYKLLGTVEIASSDILTLQPGVVVQFPYFNYDLTVNGTLTAVGTAADSIRFKGKWYDNNSTHGGKINFASTSTNSVLDYVVIDSLAIPILVLTAALFILIHRQSPPLTIPVLPTPKQVRISIPGLAVQNL